MIKNRKSIVVNYTGRKGGGSVYAYEMTKSLIENGCKVYGIISKDIDNISIWKELAFEKLIMIETYSNLFNYAVNTAKFKVFGVNKLKKEFAGIHIDAVYVPMIQPWTSLINKLFKKSQKIVTLHDPKPHSGSISYFDKLCRKASVEADDIVILSEAYREYTTQQFNKEKEDIYVIPHGVFDYYKEVQSSDSSIEYDKDKINFLFFGRITRYKGLHVLSEAYKKLSKQFDNITLTVVGSGNFDDYRKEYSLLKNVIIINRWIRDEEVGCFFKGCNIVTVLPYTDATQSGVISVAMEYKSLVIASNIGGLAEQVKHKETGYLFEANNADSLYEVMKYVVEYYSEQEQLKQNAVKYIRSLSWDVLGRKLLEIIR